MKNIIQTFERLRFKHHIYRVYPMGSSFYNNIESLIENKGNQESIFVPIEDYPKFKNLTTDYLENLRKHIHKLSDTSRVQQISFSILIFCELNQFDIKKKIKNNKNINNSNLFLQELISLFIDYYFTFNDLRYLNTALKLVDTYNNNFLNKIIIPFKKTYSKKQIIFLRNKYLIYKAIMSL